MYGGVEVLTPPFFTLALDGGEWSALRSGRFTPGKEPTCPFYRRLSGPQILSGRCGVETIIFPLSGIESRPLSHRPVTITNMVCWFLLKVYIALIFFIPWAVIPCSGIC
jgi:hypothetical protein